MTDSVDTLRRVAVQDVIRQQTRQDELERMYVEDGRDQPSHPMYMLYSGLAQSRS